MQVFENKQSIRTFLSEVRRNGMQIGLVPTMGALHEGHLSLIREAKKENDIVVCSIYVNPTQFDNKTDLAKYPKTLDRDLELLTSEGCDAVFAPTDSEMYPDGIQNISVSVNFGELEKVMEGKHRKGHFNGVGIVVSKLFNIIQPDRAYFGQKDLQQFAIINKMVQDLSFEIELKRCPIVRTEKGLAMSSRNVRLNERELFIAPTLYQTLVHASKAIENNENLERVKDEAVANICKHKDFKIEYFEIVDLNTLQSIEEYQNQSIALCVAAHLGNVRLIDNFVVN